MIVFGVVLVGLAAAFKFLPVDSYLARFLEYVQALGVWGPVLLAAVYVLAFDEDAAHEPAVGADVHEALCAGVDGGGALCCGGDGPSA